MIDTETYPMVQCVECGEQDEAAYMESMRSKMVSRSLCFTCLFWIELIENRDNDQRVVVDGTHYIACDETAPRHLFRGFGGSLFVIRFHDGRMVRSTNLWCQGAIPERFKERLPNNAEFIRE